MSVYLLAVAPDLPLSAPILFSIAMGPAPGTAPLEAPFYPPGLVLLPAAPLFSAPQSGPESAPLLLLAKSPDELAALASGVLALVL